MDPITTGPARFESDHGTREWLWRTGTPMRKHPNLVYMRRVEYDFEVETNEGVLSAKRGDFVAYDPLSGHIWPVAASYVDQHYVKAFDA